VEPGLVAPVEVGVGPDARAPGRVALTRWLLVDGASVRKGNESGESSGSDTPPGYLDTHLGYPPAIDCRICDAMGDKSDNRLGWAAPIAAESAPTPVS
jgi:hypothetical protein